jgi:hypothetical protein
MNAASSRRTRLSVTLLVACLAVAGCRHLARSERAAPPDASLPAPRDAPESPQPPRAEPRPPEISLREADKQAARLFPDTLKLLRIRGQATLLLEDLNGDGHPEGFALGIPARELSDEEMDRLTDYSRVFEAKGRSVGFYLISFQNQQGSLVPSRTDYLGKWLAYESMEIRRLDGRNASPLLVTVSFHTREGIESELLVFGDTSEGLLDRIRLKNSLNTRTYLRDLDGDGLVDIFIKERGMEEGSGVETFLSWQRWNGHRYREAGDTTVVRNLRLFLARLKQDLLAGAVVRLISYALDPAWVVELKAGGLTETAILGRALGLAEFDENRLRAIREIVFPEILEDPFGADAAGGDSFRFSIRLIDQNGISTIGTCLICMDSNPFGRRQFVLCAPPMKTVD